MNSPKRTTHLHTCKADDYSESKVTFHFNKTAQIVGLTN